MRENITHSVEGSMMLVTYQPDAYCQQPVYLHAPGQPWFKGERIGVLGSMVGHGVYATVGKVSEGFNATVANEDTEAWFCGHMTKREAVEQMVGLHLGHPVDHPAAKVHTR